ncbi:hypothetical protein [Inhella sp.]|uniref:hypothetical protein n=1 Tax=Inhella sp. TaxID=1921806 RepID=UPI0035AE6752
MRTAPALRRQLLRAGLFLPWLGLGGGLATAQAPPESLGPLLERSWTIDRIRRRLSLRVPAMARGQLREREASYYWLGNAGRFNLSLIATAPDCQGGERHAQAADCFQSRLAGLPGQLADSIERQDLPDHSRLRYWQQVPWRDRQLRIRHLHLYLALQGHWVDVHASLVEPSATERPWFDALGDSLELQRTD